jgi:hypothetical protein
MNIIDQLKETATRVFLGVLPVSADHSAPFKAQITIKVNGEVKPVVLIGTAHSKVEDGNVTVVLNPDPLLRDQLLREHGALMHLKKMLSQRCDAALTIWIDAYKNNRVLKGERYLARQMMPAKYVV